MLVLEANKVSKIYGSWEDAVSTLALDGIDLKVREGEFVSVMGPSGSGKTTLLNILSGLDRHTSGTISISGKDISSMGQEESALFRLKNIGFIFQDYNLLDSLTVKENIMLPMILDKKPVQHMEKVAGQYMNLFGIIKIKDKYPFNISGGEQQRVCIARALVNNPSILFADEPTGNLDSKSSSAVMECFHKVNEEKKATILMVTHDAYAASFSKRVVFIKDGRIYTELNKKNGRKEFFDDILDCLSVLGGAGNDL